MSYSFLQRFFTKYFYGMSLGVYVCGVVVLLCTFVNAFRTLLTLSITRSVAEVHLAMFYVCLAGVIVISGRTLFELSTDPEGFFFVEDPASGNKSTLWFHRTVYVFMAIIVFGVIVQSKGRVNGEFVVPLGIATAILLVVSEALVFHYKKKMAHG